MLTTQTLFSQPVFQERVFFKFKDNSVEIRYQNRGFAIAVPPEARAEMTRLFTLLQCGGMSIDRLAEACPQLREQLEELLAEFSSRDMLKETGTKITPSATTGTQFYRELYRFIERLKSKFPPSPFTQKMSDRTITKEQLIGYALESYHVTHLCPRLLAPALAHYESLTTQKLLQDFFVCELNHDRLLENSLTSVGITSQQLQQMQPLPMTFAVCSTLGVFARQHPLSFKSALMLFEQDDPIFAELYKQQCLEKSLPSAFYQPILLHSHINEEGEHDQITKVLLAQIPFVSPQEQLTVKKNLAVLMESMVLRTIEILDYYGNPDRPIPRCFA